MQRCLQLAENAKGFTAPNPMVGAVLVHEDRIIGEGWHHRYGEAHAEVDCLESVSEKDRLLIPASTMYVSLEPCAHYGKTPPCAQRLVQERVRKVVIVNTDPFASVNGRGIQILQDAGVEVQTGILEAEGRWLNRRFFCFHELKRPYITLKWAESAEGFIAPNNLARAQLSSAFSNTLVHRWRTEEAAILVGYNTALHDNPQLTARHWQGLQPLRIFLDRNLQLPESHSLLDGTTATWIFNEQKEATAGNNHFIKIPFENLLPELLYRLHKANKLSLIVEGGAALLQSFIKAGLWDEARIFKTPTLLGDGIAAPVIPHAQRAFEAAVNTDELQLWINNDGRFPYAAGMSL